MIKNLNMVVAQEAKSGKIVVISATDNRGAALKFFEKASTDKKYSCVVHIRNPKFDRRKFPAKAAQIKKERLEAKAKEEDEAKKAAEADEESTDPPADPPAEDSK